MGDKSHRDQIVVATNTLEDGTPRQIVGRAFPDKTKMAEIAWADVPPAYSEETGEFSEEDMVWNTVLIGETLGYFNRVAVNFKTFILSLVSFVLSVLLIWPWKLKGEYVTDIAWPEARRLYVSTGDGNMYVSTDMGNTFTPISVGITDGDLSLTAGGERI